MPYGITVLPAGTRLSDPGGMQGRADLVGLLHTEMVYPPEDSSNRWILCVSIVEVFCWGFVEESCNAALHFTAPGTA